MYITLDWDQNEISNIKSYILGVDIMENFT